MSDCVFEKNRGYKSCCSSEMRAISVQKKVNSPVYRVDVVGGGCGNVVVKPHEFLVHSTIIMERVPESFSLSNIEECKRFFGTAMCVGVLGSCVTMSWAPVTLALLYAGASALVLRRPKALPVVAVGGRSTVDDIDTAINSVIDQTVFVIDRPSMEVWDTVVKGSVSLKLRLCLRSFNCRLVIVPALWQLDHKSDVYAFSEDVWREDVVYCCEEEEASEAGSETGSETDGGATESAGSSVLEWEECELSESTASCGGMGATISSK